ncbi:calcium-binding protein [Lutimaribacter marinistellae]|uniref:Calcium-binding protein n=1 Tax=Lutimaribacter marinistellae TaxID=1820329 RepID=A0ABV7TKS5_9RHOB
MPDTLNFSQRGPQITISTPEGDYFSFGSRLLPLGDGGFVRFFSGSSSEGENTFFETLLPTGESTGAVARPFDALGQYYLGASDMFALTDGSARIVVEVQQTNTEGRGESQFQTMLYSPDTGALTEPVTLHQFEAFGSFEVYRTFSNPDGSFALITQTTPENIPSVQLFGPDGTPVAEAYQFPESASTYSTEIGFRDNGQVLATWQETQSNPPQFDETTNRIQVQLIGTDGTAGQVRTVATALSDGTGPYTTLFPEGFVEQPGQDLVLFWGRQQIQDGIATEDFFAQKLGADGTPAGSVFDLGQFDGILDKIAYPDGSFALVTRTEVPVGNSWTQELTLRRFDADGQPIGEPAVLDRMRDWRDIELLPDGGVAIASVDYSQNEGDLHVRFFDETGAPEGPGEVIFSMDNGSPGADILLRDDGTFLIQALSQDRHFQEYAKVDFRPLTDGDDTETLTGPEAVDGLAGDDNLTGSDEVDRLKGGEGNDTLEGGAGDDFLSGGPGTNVLNGGDGDDSAWFTGPVTAYTFESDETGDLITILLDTERHETTGIEEFVFTDQILNPEQVLIRAGFFDMDEMGGDTDDLLQGGPGNDRLDGAGGNDTVHGAEGTDTLLGGNGDDIIVGGETPDDIRDIVFAGAGNDSVDAGYGNDQVFGQEGNDTISGGFGADEIQGQEGDDFLSGGALSDLIYGGAGRDFINGGYGYDRINGGDGGDRFFHLGVFGHGSDWLQDYDAAEGDLLVFGGAATADQFQVNLAHTATPDGERSGDDAVQEAFVIYRPTGQILWALVDGEAQDEINLRIGDDVFDLLA